MPRTPWTTLPDAAESAQWDATAADVATALAVDALARDRANEQPTAELKLLKESGLVDLLIPTEYGGHGGHWSIALRAVRILARADASIAQILAYHYVNHAGIVFFGDPARWPHWFEASAAGLWLWGDSVNPIDPDLALTADGPGYRLDGRKRYSTGASTGDVTLVMGAEQGRDLGIQVGRAKRLAQHPVGVVTQVGEAQGVDPDAQDRTVGEEDVDPAGVVAPRREVRLDEAAAVDPAVEPR